MKRVIVACISLATSGLLCMQSPGLNNALLAEINKEAKTVDLDRVRELISQGASPDAIDSNGATALMLAVNLQNIGLSKLLLACKADVNKPGFHFASTPLMWAITADNIKLCKLLLENGAKTNVRNGLGETPLIRALERRNPAIIDLLYVHGARE